MRSFALILLLAGTATPALSQDWDRSGDRRSERSERAELPARAELGGGGRRAGPMRRPARLRFLPRDD